MSNVNKATPTVIYQDENFLNIIKKNYNNKKFLLVTSRGFRTRGIVDKIEKTLKKNLIYTLDNITANPTIEYLDKTFKILKKLKIESVIALGGGSVIDSGKAIAKLLCNNKNNITLHEHFIEKKHFLDKSSALPLIAIPTTAGTGSEITHFATIWDDRNKKKYSLSGNELYPNISILDPELTLSLPREETVASALDTMSHALESLWNQNATNQSISNSKKSLKILFSSLHQLIDPLSGNNIKLRSNLLEASMYAGFAIDQTRTALAHSISYPLTLMYNLPHGIASSFTLPSVLNFNKDEDDGRISKISEELGFKNIKELENKILYFFIELGGLKIMKKYISNFENILELTNQMITPERSGNNLRDASISDIKEIINRTIKIFKNY